jgi:hypothetical protein
VRRTQDAGDFERFVGAAMHDGRFDAESAMETFEVRPCCRHLGLCGPNRIEP